MQYSSRSPLVWWLQLVTPRARDIRSQRLMWYTLWIHVKYHSEKILPDNTTWNHTDCEPLQIVHRLSDEYFTSIHQASSLLQGQIQKLSVASSSTEPCERLDTFAYWTVNFARNFAHERSEYAQKSSHKLSWLN